MSDKRPGSFPITDPSTLPIRDALALLADALRGYESLTDFEKSFAVGLASILMSGKCAVLTPNQGTTLVSIAARVTLRPILHEDIWKVYAAAYKASKT